MEEWINQFYKSKGGFAKRTLENRRSTTVEKRRDYRNSLLSQFRQIPKNMSPLVTNQEEELQEEKPVLEKKSKRLEMLEKWKKEKERKKLEALKNKKPIFKVCHVESNENEKLNQAFNYIKGKKIIKEEMVTKGKLPEKTLNQTCYKNKTNSSSKSISSKQPNAPSKSVGTKSQKINSKEKIVNRKRTTAKIKTVNISGNNERISEAIENLEENSGRNLVVIKNSDEVFRELPHSNNNRNQNMSRSSSEEEFKNQPQCSINLKPQTSANWFTNGSTPVPYDSQEVVKTRSSVMKSSSRKNIENLVPKNAGISQNREIDVSYEVINKSPANNIQKSLKKRKDGTSPKYVTVISASNVDLSATNETVLSRRHRNMSTISSKLPEEDSERTLVTVENPEEIFREKSNSSSDYNETQNMNRSLPKEDFKDRLQCSVNLTPLTFANCAIVSTPFPNDSDEVVEIRSSVLKSSSKKKSKNVTPRIATRSQNNRNEIRYNSPSKNTGTYLKVRKEDTPNDITVISTPNGEMFVTDEIARNRGSKKLSSKFLESSNNPFLNSTDIFPLMSPVVILKDRPAFSASNEAETSGISRSGKISSNTAKTPRRSSRRILNINTIEEYTTDLENQRNSPRLEKNQKSSTSLISRKSVLEAPKTEWKLRLNDTYEEKTPNKSSTKKKIEKSREVGSSSYDNEEYFTPTKITEGSPNNDVFATPNLPKKDDDLIVYVSPFVTVSRGKSAARKEYQTRKSLDGLNSSIAGSADPKSPKAAAAYFERALNREISKIQNLCNMWQNYKETGNLSDDACGLIDMTIGQSNLLLTKKFNQFRGLIEKCRTNDQSGMRIQCEDLHGFWDMIFKQVDDLEKRFENLEDMKRNNWLETAPKKKAQIKKGRKAKKNNKRAKSASEASSLLREAILAARKKNALLKTKSDEDMMIHIVKKNSTPRRSVLADSSLTNIPTEPSTPAKGILKSGNSKSEKRKTVVFKEARISVGEGKENKYTPASNRRDTPLPSRKSKRISLGRSKLEFD